VFFLSQQLLSVLLTNCVLLSATIFANLSRPEVNSPFIIYDVNGLKGAKEGTEVGRAFYMLMEVEPRFLDMDDTTTWYSAHTVGAQVHFKVPAWPFPLFPSPLNKKSDEFFKSLTEQVPNVVSKAIVHVHSVFDEGNESTHIVEGRKWKTIILDFSRTKGVGSLSSAMVFADAGDKDMLDYDYLQLPIYDEKNKIVGNQVFLGFKVGVIPPDGDAARKVNRTGPAKSKMAQKKAAATAAASAGKSKMDTT
jgi:hypothetical protein